MKNIDCTKFRGFVTIPTFVIATLFSLFITGALSAQCDGNVRAWYNKKEWTGTHKIKPHKSINQVELARQYCLNPEWWEKAFQFISTNDLESIDPGRYVIDEGNVIAYITDATVKEMDSIQWESHENFNDLQYIIKGKAKMGVVALGNAQFRITTPYDPQKDVVNYHVEKAEYYVANKGSFFIFSPTDIHRPAGKIKGQDTIKKLLIKVRVPAS